MEHQSRLTHEPSRTPAEASSQVKVFLGCRAIIFGNDGGLRLTRLARCCFGRRRRWANPPLRPRHRATTVPRDAVGVSQQNLMFPIFYAIIFGNSGANLLTPPEFETHRGSFEASAVRRHPLMTDLPKILTTCWVSRETRTPPIIRAPSASGYKKTAPVWERRVPCGWLVGHCKTLHALAEGIIREGESRHLLGALRRSFDAPQGAAVAARDIAHAGVEFNAHCIFPLLISGSGLALLGRCQPRFPYFQRRRVYQNPLRNARKIFNNFREALAFTTYPPMSSDYRPVPRDGCSLCWFLSCDNFRASQHSMTYPKMSEPRPSSRQRLGSSATHPSPTQRLTNPLVVR